MPNNLQALIRYRTIDRCLRSGGKSYHLKDLIAACCEDVSAHTGNTVTISRRTLLYDLEFLKNEEAGFGAPIEYDSTDGYYYTAHGYSIFNIPIRRYDIDVLRDAMGTLQSISGRARFQGLSSIIARIEETYNIVRPQQERRVLQFEHSLNEAGQRWVDEVYTFAKAQKAMHVTYQPFGSEPYPVLISPYLLKEYNNRWFLIGFDHEYRGIVNLALDRMQSIAATLQPFIQTPGFDADRYLEDIIGVSIPREGEKKYIEIKAYGRLSSYLKTKPLHTSQKVVREEEGATTFSLHLIPNYELESALLARGESLEVLSPPSLRETFRQRTAALAQLYQHDLY